MTILLSRRVAFVATLVLFLLGACTSPAPEPTTVPTGTATARPSATATLPLTQTDTPEPTNTSTATPTATIQPTLALGEVNSVPTGGFSFQVPAGYGVDIQEAQVGVIDPTGMIIISMIGVGDFEGDQMPEEIIDEFLAELAESSDGEFHKGDPYPVVVDGIEGLAFDLEGGLLGAPIHGQTVLVTISPAQYFYALGFANLSQDGQLWEDEGSPAFAALLGSVKFSPPVSAGVCPISSDPTYGYTQTNPIEVGGGPFDGPARERAYLDNLRGPNGEALGYSRTGSLPTNTTILDIYQITGLNQTVTLYIDEYNYSEPMAPVGFTCAAAFPLAPP